MASTRKLDFCAKYHTLEPVIPKDCIIKNTLLDKESAWQKWWEFLFGHISWCFMQRALNIRYNLKIIMSQFFDQILESYYRHLTHKSRLKSWSTPKMVFGGKEKDPDEKLFFWCYDIIQNNCKSLKTKRPTNKIDLFKIKLFNCFKLKKRRVGLTKELPYKNMSVSSMKTLFHLMIC